VAFAKVAQNGIDISRKAVDTLPLLESIDPSLLQHYAILGVRHHDLQNMTKRLSLKLFAVGLVVATVAIVVIVKSKRVHGQNPPPCTSDWVTKLQHGIDSEAPCPTSLSNISSSVSNLSLFTQYRCGFSLSNTVQQRIAQLEQEAWPGNCTGVCQLTRLEIKNIITAEYLALASTLTDAQITGMSQSFQVVPAWVPSTRSTDVQLTSSGNNISPSDFVQGLQLLRSGNSTAQATATAQITSHIDDLCNVLAYALPSDWNVSIYSPYRAYVIAYCLASDDRLADSHAECETRMMNTQNWLFSKGFNVPCEGRALWGDSGYIYTRPISIAFSEAVQSDLLNRYAAVHGLQ